MEPIEFRIFDPFTGLIGKEIIQQMDDILFDKLEEKLWEPLFDMMDTQLVNPIMIKSYQDAIKLK